MNHILPSPSFEQCFYRKSMEVFYLENCLRHTSYFIFRWILRDLLTVHSRSTIFHQIVIENLLLNKLTLNIISWDSACWWNQRLRHFRCSYASHGMRRCSKRTDPAWNDKWTVCFSCRSSDSPLWWHALSFDHRFFIDGHIEMSFITSLLFDYSSIRQQTILIWSTNEESSDFLIIYSIVRLFGSRLAYWCCWSPIDMFWVSWIRSRLGRIVRMTQ